MTLFGIYMRLCGLSRTAAAAFLNQKEETVKSEQQGKFRPRDGVMTELSGLRDRIVQAAEDVLDKVASVEPPYEVEVAGDDEAARAMGWPSAGPQQIMVELVVDELPFDQIRLVTLRGADLVRSVEECRALTDPSSVRSARMRERRGDPDFAGKLQAGLRGKKRD